MKGKKKIILISSIVLTAVVAIVVGILLSTPKYYIVEFDSMGGTLVESQKIKKGHSAVKPTDPIKEGYIFIEWQHQNKIYDFSFGVKDNITLTAKWEEKEDEKEMYVVQFDSDGGTTIPNQILEKGATITRPEDPTKEGYKFIEWTFDSITYNFDKTIEDDITLVAKYEKLGEDETESSNNQTSNSNTNENQEQNQTQENTSKPNTPKLTIPGLSASDMPGYGEKAENGVYMYDLGINSKDYLVKGSKTKYTIDGYEVYEKTGTKYNKIASGKVAGAVTVKTEPGTKKILVARVYVLNSKGNKVYSGYSNEVTIDKTTYKTPVLRTTTDGYLENGKYTYDLAINFSDYLVTGTDYTFKVDGYDVFEKDGTNYKYIKSATMGGAAVVEVEVGTKKTFVAKVYVLNSKGNKVYSGYSNELVIDKTDK